MKFRRYWWFFLISCPQLLIAGNRFIVPAGTSISDIMVTHYPNLLFIQQSLLNGHGIPLWSPLIFSGYPFGANPLSTLWYPPAWLAVCFPLPLGINLVMALHVIAGCAGMVYYLRILKVNEPLALLGGILFGLLPVGFARVTGGHFTWICASAWFPWLLALSYSQYKSAAGKVILSAGAIGLMLLADLRFAVYAVVIWILLSISSGISDRDSSIQNRWEKLGLVGLSLLMGLGLSAIVWLPLMEFSALSTRSLLTTKDTLFLSLPALQLLGILVPGHPQTFEWVIYLGAGLIIPGLFSLTLLRKKKILLFWWVTAVLCLTWSLGDMLPFNQLLAGLPGVNLLRVPARASYFFSVALLIISIISMDHFLEGKKDHLKFFRLGVLGILVFSAMVQIGTYLLNPVSNSMLLFHAIFTLIISFLFLVFSYNRITGQIFTAIFTILIICDFSMANWGLVGYRSLPDVLAEGAEESAYLVSKGADFREFSPSYSIPQQTAVYSNLELVEGIDPLQLESYVNFVDQSAHLSSSEYSVTLPAFTTGNPKDDNAGIRPDAAAFGLLNARYMVSAFPVDSNGWVLEKKTNKNYIYFNGFTRGWAWVENGGINPEEGYSPVISISRSSNEIVVEAEGPGRLVLSEVNYPGWAPSVDDVPQKIGIAHSILRSVELPSGRHTIRFRFIPILLFAGAGISVLSLLISLILLKKSATND